MATQKTILIVDDELGSLCLLSLVMKRKEHRVLMAGSGEEAVRVCREHAQPIDLLFTDVLMPGMTGPQLARTLTAMQPGLKVVFTTSASWKAVEMHFPTGAKVELLPKPLHLDEIARHLDLAIAGNAFQF